jgi:hypothetical protein
MYGPPDPDWLPISVERLPTPEQFPSPGRREAVVAAVLLLVLAGVWVRLADPVALRDDPPTVDPGDPPGDVAADAVERLEYVDYTYRLSPNRGTAQVTRVDNTDRELYSAFGSVRKRYATEGAAWVQLQGGPWRALDSSRFSAERASPFDPDAIRAADVAVVREVDGILVVAIDDAGTIEAVVGRGVEADRFELHVDTEAGRIVRARLHRSVGESSGWWEYDFYDYGATDVARPPNVPGLTFEEAIRDIVRG